MRSKGLGGENSGPLGVTIIKCFVGVALDIETGFLYQRLGRRGGLRVKPLTLRWVSRFTPVLDIPSPTNKHDWKDVWNS
jgi:hypothetical protein